VIRSLEILVDNQTAIVNKSVIMDGVKNIRVDITMTTGYKHTALNFQLVLLSLFLFFRDLQHLHHPSESAHPNPYNCYHPCAILLDVPTATSSQCPSPLLPLLHLECLVSLAQFAPNDNHGRILSEKLPKEVMVLNPCYFENQLVCPCQKLFQSTCIPLLL